MRKVCAFFYLPLILFHFDASAIAQTESFSVIVNEQNPVTSTSRRTVSRWFLKKTTVWQDGTAILPVDLPEGSSVRQSFSAFVHKRSSFGVSNYWQRQIFTGAGMPPETMNTEAEVIEWVRKNRGAIGYVSKNTRLEGVRVLEVIE